MKNIFLLLIVCSLSLSLVYAQSTIVLKSGREVKGRLVEKTDGYVKVDVDGIELTYGIDEIESIDSKDISSSREAAMTIKKVKKLVTITGKLMFDDWRQGFIRIAVFDGPDPRIAREIGSVDIPKPGAYRLRLEAFLEDTVSVHAYNDSENNGPPKQTQDPTFFYNGIPDNTVLITGLEIGSIDLKQQEKNTDNTF